MLNFITQLRRGTTEDWLASTVIPLAGELILEQPEAGPIRLKLGDGINLFKDLKYIDQDLTSDLANLTAEFNSFVAGPDVPTNTIETEVSNARYVHGTKYPSLKEAIESVADKQISGLIYDTAGTITGTPYMLYLKDKDDNVLTKTGVQIISGAGGGGGSTQGVFEIKYAEGFGKTQYFAATDTEMNLQFLFNATDAAGDLIDQVNGELYVNDKLVEYKTIYSMYADPDKSTNIWNLKDYVEVGRDNTILVIARDNLGRFFQKEWVFTVVDIQLTTNFDDNICVRIPDDIPFTLPYNIRANADRTIDVYINGEHADGYPKTYLADESGEGGFLLPQKYSEHGSYMIELRGEAIVDNKRLPAKPLYVDLLVFNEKAYRGEALIGITERAIKASQYEDIKIDYAVYQPSVPSPEVKIFVDEELSATRIIDSNTHVDSFTYRFDTVKTEEDIHKIIFKCGETTKTVEVVVKPSKDKIEPITDYLAFDFNPVGRTNADSDRSWKWERKDVNGELLETVDMNVSSNFDWRYGGYKFDQDAEGNDILGSEHFVVKAGTFAEFTYKLFPNKDVTQTTGREFKLIFKTTNVSDATKPFLDCMSYENPDSKIGVGIQMFPHEAVIQSGNDTLRLAYSETDVIEFEFNLTPRKGVAVPCLTGYEDGVASRVLPYTDADHFGQPEGKEKTIIIAPTTCDVHIYRCKAYTSALSDTQILKNFEADARSYRERVARFTRNQIYVKGELTPEGLAIACPQLRVYKLSAPLFTNDKDNSIKGTTIQQIYEGGDPLLDNWTCYNCEHSGQGTSSNKYGAAGRNLDFKMNVKGAQIVLGKPNEANKVNVDAITLTRKSVPTNYLNLKVNIASSNNLTNALIAKEFNEHQRYKPAREPRITSGVYYDKDTSGNYVKKENAIIPKDYIKDTMEFYNCAIFIQETDPNVDIHREFKDTKWHFYAMGNIGDSKKTDKTRLVNPDDKYECCIEILDVDLELSNFPVGRMTRAPKNPYVDDDDNILLDMSVAEKNRHLLYKGDFKETTHTKMHIGTPYYRATSEAGVYEAVGYTGHLTEKQFADLHLYEGTFTCMSDIEEPLDYDKYVYYFDALECDNFKEALTYGWRYSSDKKKSEITKVGKRAWIQFYEFLTTADEETFAAKFGNYMNLDSAIYDYIFTLRYCMVDNRAKNTFWHFAESGEYHKVDDPHVDLLPIYYERVDSDYVLTKHTEIVPGTDYYCQHVFDLNWDYDNDTSLGLDNYGRQVYRHGYEDHDLDSTGSPVFREHDTTFFSRLAVTFANKIKDMYKDLEDLGAWNTSALISECDSWQEQFPEELWRLDIQRKYIRTYVPPKVGEIVDEDTQFLQNMCNGRMKYHRRHWLRSQNSYMAAKYCTSYCKDRVVDFRTTGGGNTASYDLTLKPYDYTYINVQEGEGQNVQIIHSKRVDKLDTEYTVKIKPKDLISIYGADSLMSLGDLSKLYLETGSFNGASRITDLKLGDGGSYDNTGFTGFRKATNPLLSSIDIQNVSGLSGVLELDSLINLQNVKAKGTQLTAITLPVNGRINHIEYPSSIQELKFQELYYLKYDKENSEDITVAGDSFTNVTKLTIEDCPNINALDLLQACPKPSENRDMRIKLYGLEWTFANDVESEKVKDYFDETFAGYTGINRKLPELGGVVNVNYMEGEHFTYFKENYPDLKFNYNMLSCAVEFWSFPEEGKPSELLRTVRRVKSTPILTIEDPVAAGDLDIPTRTPTDSTAYTFVGWSLLDDGIPRAESPLNNVEGNIKVYPTFSSATRQYEVKFCNNDGSLLKTVLADYGTDEVDYFADGAEEPENALVTNSSSYRFTGWNPEPKNITGNVTCYAVYTMKEDAIYTIQPDSDFTYDLQYDDNQLIITNYITKDKKIIRILDTYNINGVDYTVTTIANSAFERKSLEWVVLPNTLEIIGDHAFAVNSRITSLTIPQTVKTINACAFTGCSGLQTVNYNAIEATLIREDSNDNAFSDTQSLNGFEVNIGPDVVSIPDYLFQYSGAKTLKFDKNSSCTRIGVRAFSSSLISGDIELPEGLIEIHKYAFSACSITKILLPATLQTIFNYAFEDNNTLVRVNIPPSLSKIDENPFAKCPNIIFTIDADSQTGKTAPFEWHGNCLLQRTTNEAIETRNVIYGNQNSVIPVNMNIVSIGSRAFAGMEELTSISIPDGVTKIKSYAFNNCSNLSFAQFPLSLTEIGQAAFSDCPLSEIQLIHEINNEEKSNVESIDITAFRRNLKIKSVRLPSSVEKISNKIFVGCPSLNTATLDLDESFSWSITSGESYSLFSGCENLTVMSVKWKYFTEESSKIHKYNLDAPWGAGTTEMSPDTYNDKTQIGVRHARSKDVIVTFADAKVLYRKRDKLQATGGIPQETEFEIIERYEEGV